MYHSWLDGWDERRARRGDEAKKNTAFGLGAELAFPEAQHAATFDDFCRLADLAVADPRFFEPPSAGENGFAYENGWLKFPSDLSTDVEENNTVWAKVTESGSLNQAMVIFHHWNATTRNDQIAKIFSRLGITVVEVAMPYHFERSRPGSFYADYILSANLGRTLQSLRQAVWDGRKIIRWLERQGYRKISVLGMSLGSWVAGLVATHDHAVSKASLFLTAGSLADMVWTGRATRSIRESLAPHMGVSDLRRAWAPLNMENFADRMARPSLDLHVVLAKRDTVVLPELSGSFLQKLKDAGTSPHVMNVDCGHYSLALPPYILKAGWSLKRFLSR
ncbi:MULTISPECIES: alpha/beta fold hydrolase [Agrobacterium]|uniref:alpha/beta fold hydrolase n=1 Tax=Agrobacterium TaxID=357 RepID=UPI0009BBCB95|nr:MULTISPECIES: dienelactone hydrolase-related enzyme [Agrobacterium]QCL77457.1 dienelactone hydrolase-related enzyme [Agrobacterium tumefaciens]CUX72376.1 conserved hypothetical protein [Agrobacterium sp. NCPPB 925]